MASVRPKGRGYEARVSLNGKPLSKVLPTREEAEKWIAGVRFGFIPPEPKRHLNAHCTTFREVCDRYELEVIPTHKGARQEINRLRHIKALPFATNPIDNITSEDLKPYRDELINRGLSGSTVRLNLALISAIFSHARKEWGLLLQNPVANIKKPKAGKARSRRLEPGEESRMLATVAQCKNKHVIRTVEFLLHTGVRKSEALGLRWEDVDLRAKIITIRDSKNGETRWIPMSEKIIDLLQRADACEKPFPISASALDQAWQHAVKRAGIKDFRIHDLRHEAISRWANIFAGDVFKLANLSGHKDLKMLRRYVNPAQAEIIAKTLDCP